MPNYEELSKLIGQALVEGNPEVEQAMKNWAAEKGGALSHNFHGTDASFDNLEPSVAGKSGPGVYVAPTARMAGSYAKGEGANILPVVVRGHLYDQMNPSDLAKVTEAIGSDPVISDKAGFIKGSDGSYHAIKELLPKLGYTGSRDFGETVVFDPTDIKSRFAQFKGPGLSGALAGAALLGGNNEAQASDAPVPNKATPTFFQRLGQNVLDQMKNSNDSWKQWQAEQADRTKMAANPAIQGPSLPAYTNADNAVAGQAMGMAMGSMGAQNYVPNYLKSIINPEVAPIAANAIKASPNLSDLTGQGTEYLTGPEGDVRAKFQDGNFATEPVGNDEPTVSPTFNKIKSILGE